MLPAREPSGRPRKVALQITICKTCNQISKIFHRLLKSKTMPESSSIQRSALVFNSERKTKPQTGTNIAPLGVGHWRTHVRWALWHCAALILNLKFKRNLQTCLSLCVSSAPCHCLCQRHFSTLRTRNVNVHHVRLSIMMTVVQRA